MDSRYRLGSTCTFNYCILSFRQAARCCGPQSTPFSESSALTYYSVGEKTIKMNIFYDREAKIHKDHFKEAQITVMISGILNFWALPSTRSVRLSRRYPEGAICYSSHKRHSAQLILLIVDYYGKNGLLLFFVSRERLSSSSPTIDFSSCNIQRLDGRFSATSRHLYTPIICE